MIEEKLIFFDKEGNQLNTRWNESTQQWQIDLLFSENSSDTFRTYGLYTYEKVDAFNYLSDRMILEKWQLFNERGIDYWGGATTSFAIKSITPVNKDLHFFSKWVSGDNFEVHFPKGSYLRFENNIFGLGSRDQIYQVVDTKEDAVMIVSTTSNSSFYSIWGNSFSSTSSYIGASASRVNLISVNDYKFDDGSSKLSTWSEQDFSQRIFDGRKLTVVNSQNNDGIYTVTNKNLVDGSYLEYYFFEDSVDFDDNIICRLTLLTKLPVIWEGTLGLSGSNIYFSTTPGDILKPGSLFYIPQSLLNIGTIQIGDILNFNQILTSRHFNFGEQILYNGKIYQCIESYTHSINAPVYPTDTIYWSSEPDYLPTKSTFVTENIPNATIQLNNNVIIFEGGSYSPPNTTNIDNIAKFVDKFGDEFLKFDLDLSFDGRRLVVSPLYISKYFELNFYKNNYLTQITATSSVFNRNIEIRERLTNEKSRDFCEIFNYNIFFSDIDDFGIELMINSQIYHQDTVWAYSGVDVDLEKTIHQTLKAWRDKYFSDFSKLGIVITLNSKNDGFYYNTINLANFYPNVELNFSVRVGTTAKFDILYYVGEFNQVGPQLSLFLNDREFSVISVTSSFGYDVSGTLDLFIETWEEYLDQLGVFTVRVNPTTIELNIKDVSSVRSLYFHTYLNLLPGQIAENSVYKVSGKLGNLITSNALILASGFTSSFSQSFYDVNFSGGMLISLLNSFFTYNNRDYNIIYLKEEFMNLSYEGPFWGTPCRPDDNYIVQYPDGYTYAFCTPYSGFIGSEFAIGSWTSAFFTGTFSQITSYFQSSQDIISGSLDLIYTPLSQKYYVLGNSLESFDATSKYRLKTINLPGNLGSKFLRNNTYNNYLYVATQTLIYKINTFSDEIVSTFSVQDPFDLKINGSNGDIYITLTFENDLLIYDQGHYLIKNYDMLQNGRIIEFNTIEQKAYVTTDTSKLIEVNTQTRLLTASYSITNLGEDLFYHQPTSTIIGVANSGLYTIKGSTVSTPFSITVDHTGNNFFSYNKDESKFLLIDPTGKLYGFDDSFINIYSSTLTSNNRIVTNPVDRNFYVGLLNKATVLNSLTGLTQRMITLSSNLGVNIYNPQRRSVFFLQPSANKLVEISVQVVSLERTYSQEFEEVVDNYLGSLSVNYEPESSYWIRTRDFIRYPRENYDYQTPHQTQFVWKWQNPLNMDYFLFDFSGDMLTNGGSYSYTGPKPLTQIVLNKLPNRDLERVSDPKYQQTVFDQIDQTLLWVNSSTDPELLPRTKEIFIGFNSKIEGVSTNNLLLYKRETATFSVTPTLTNNNYITYKLSMMGDITVGKIILDPNSDENFINDLSGTPRGFIPGQIIQISISDTTNLKDQYVSFNNGLKVKIREMYPRELVVDFMEDPFVPESNRVVDYPLAGDVTFLRTSFTTVDRIVANFRFSAQTDIEDPRFGVEISNTGKNLSSEVSWIFKRYDINEQGIDWNFLNQKRKEYLYARDQIFPYVGSYKAIINAINFFGYNDLILNEYYKNTDENSANYQKLFKVEIPDVFDNTVKGWNSKDYLNFTLPNPKYASTKLFNLAYRITDKEGNYSLYYTVFEALVKLHGLKLWLQNNVIPLTHRILDITGEAWSVGQNTISHRNYDIKVIKVSENFSPIDFRVDEAYLLPITSGSQVFNVVINFFTREELTDPFSLEVRTYQTFREWEPFKIYSAGEKVKYFDRLYESTKSNNRINNPRKYEGVAEWVDYINYEPGQIVNYDLKTYIFAGTQSLFDYSTFSTNPVVDSQKWTDISYWKRIGLEPVQNLFNYKDTLSNFNFTIDTSVDPFISIKTISENGRGGYYIIKKNYEIRWIDDNTLPTLVIAEDPLPDRTLYTTTTTSTTTVCPDNCINYQFCEDLTFTWYFS